MASPKARASPASTPITTISGVSVARNLGLERASGDIIAYLDTDNLWDKDYLAIMVAALADRRGYQTAYAGQIISRTVPGTDASSAWEEQKAIRLCPFNRSRLEERNFIDLNIFVHRRHLHGLYGGFDETLRRLGDWDLILRYTREWPPLMVPALLVVESRSSRIPGTASSMVLPERLMARPSTTRLALLADCSVVEKLKPGTAASVPGCATVKADAAPLVPVSRMV